MTKKVLIQNKKPTYWEDISYSGCGCVTTLIFFLCVVVVSVIVLVK